MRHHRRRDSGGGAAVPHWPWGHGSLLPSGEQASALSWPWVAAVVGIHASALRWPWVAAVIWRTGHSSVMAVGHCQRTGLGSVLAVGRHHLRETAVAAVAMVVGLPLCDLVVRRSPSLPEDRPTVYLSHRGSPTATANGAKERVAFFGIRNCLVFIFSGDNWL